jgi:hypothetical protein
MANRTIPQVKPLRRRNEDGTEVPVSFIKGPAGPSVEEARQAMLAAKEAVTTHGGGTKVPSFIHEAAPANQPIVPEPVKTDAEIAAERHAQETVPSRGTGGNTSGPARVGRWEASDLLASARQKLMDAGVTRGMRVNLNRMCELGWITRAEVDALVADANGQPIPVPELVIEPVTEEVPVSAPASAPVEAVEPARVPVDPTDGQRRTIENKKFTGQIYREGKEWIAEIVYKNGAGTERFAANSKDELMLKLVEGKGNGTLRVREAVRREKLGSDHDTWDFFYDQMKESHGLTVEQYNALPVESRNAIQDVIQAAQIQEFVANTPEYYGTTHNFQEIVKFLNKQKPNPWPMTVHNLQLAFEDLLEAELLDTKPAVQVAAPAPVAVAPVLAPTVTPDAEDSAPIATPAPAVVVPVTPVRKRGTTGIMPGSSSATPSLGTTEDGTRPRELSVAELKKLPDAELKRIATQNRKYGRY